MSKQTPRLGKGLRTLIGPRAASQPVAPRVAPPPPGAPPAGGARLFDVALDRIEPNPEQPRTHMDEDALAELSASIKTRGVLQPVLLRPAGDNRYQIIAGERRWRAAAKAGLTTIPAIIREISDAEAFELALIENLQREDLDPLERATAYQQLIDKAGFSVDELATRLGESRASIANYLRILKLDKQIREMISAGQLGMGQARAIAGMTNPQRQLAIARMAVRRNLSVRQVETLVRQEAEQPQRTPPAPTSAAKHFADVEETLSKALGLSVRLHPGKRKNSGRIVIRYNSLEEFDRIAERISGRTLVE